MIRVKTEIPDVEESIQRPVSLQISRGLLKALGIPSTVRILYPSGIEETPQTGSEYNYNGQVARFGADTQLRVEVTAEEVEDRTLNIATMQRENVPIFYDDKLNIKIWPIYSAMELKFQFEFRTTNRVMAKRIRSEMLTGSARLREMLAHEFTYSYLIPHSYFEVLRHIHALRETVNGYQQTFEEWFSANITARASNVANSAGQALEVAINEAQKTVIGYFDFNAVAAPEEKNGDNGTWKISFGYTVGFDQVIELGIQYPLLVHNQLIDDRYYSSPNANGETVDPYDGKRVPSSSRHDFDKLSPIYQDTRVKRPELTRLPSFDNWSPKYTMNGYVPFLQLLTMVPTTDVRELINLQELGDHQLSCCLIDYFKAAHRDLNVVGGAMVYVALYEDDEIRRGDWIEIDSDLNVRATRDLDLRKTYRVMLYLNTDVFVLSTSQRGLLMRHGEAARLLLGWLQLHTQGRVMDMPLTSTGIMRSNVLTQVGQFIIDAKIPHQIGVEYPTSHAADYTIVAHRLNGVNDGIGNQERSAESGTDPQTGTDTATGRDAGDSVPNCDC